MSILLYRLGQFSFRRPWVFITVWLLLFAGIFALIVSGGSPKISTAVTIDGTEAQNVIDELRAEFPEMSGGQGTIVIVGAGDERLDEGDSALRLAAAATDISDFDFVVEREVDPSMLAAIAEAQSAAQANMTPEQIAKMREMQASGAPATQPAPLPVIDDKIHPLIVDMQPVAGVLVSADGQTAMMQVQFTEQIERLPVGAIDSVVDIAQTELGATGAEVLTSESLKPHAPPIGGHEALGLLVAALVLVLTLGSLRAAGLPLLTALLGVGVGVGGALTLSALIPMTSATLVLAIMIGLAVGIDYALFIVNRQRRLILTEKITAVQAAGRAVGTAGSAVVFAGLTVVIALVALTLIGISFLSTMAIVAAVTVALAVLIAITLLPALLGVLGERIVSKRARAKGADLITREHRGFAHRFVSTVVRGRWAVIIGIIALLGLAALPMSSMTLGMPNGATANLDTHERQAYDAISEGFGEGYNAPLMTMVRIDGGEITSQDLDEIVASLEKASGVDTVKPAGISPDGALAVVTVIPDDSPDAESTSNLVHTLRADGAELIGIDGASIGVTGFTAVNIDISEKLASVLPLYITIIVVLSLLVLLMVFRSILIPIKATLGFLLTISATFGVMTVIFQWGWFKEILGFDTTGPILSFLPIMVTGILYGLAMDYEMFLVSSMREAHVHGHKGNDSIIHGFDQAGRVVLAAAVIMVSVFAGFMFSGDPTVKQLGTALAVGILIDAFLVRMMLVPALMSLVGRSIWWLPKWMDRILPRLDVEGDRLSTHLAQPESSRHKR